MKRIIENTILFFAVLMALGACNDLNIHEPVAAPGEGLITLELRNAVAAKPGTRAGETVAAEDYEKTVNHVDILIFNNGSGDIPSTLKLHVRKESTEWQGTTIVLGNKTLFELNTDYWIYVIANSELDSSEFEGEDYDFTDFCALAEKNARVFLTGHENLSQAHVTIPEFFLMDGVAYNGETEPADDKKEPFTLNDNITSQDLKLKVTLRRAAAKIKINILETPENGTLDKDGNVVPNAPWVDFDLLIAEDPTYNQDAVNAAGFYFRDLPYSSSIIGDSRYQALIDNKTLTKHEAQVRNTVKYNGSRFHEQSVTVTENQEQKTYNGIVITTYAYARDWSHVSSMLGTSIIANIPLHYHEYVSENSDGTPFTAETEGAVLNETDGKYYKWVVEDLASNYYQIPVSQNKVLVRNGYYEVTVKISIPGGSEPGEPVKLENIAWEVHEWTPEYVSVGDEKNNPVYLEVNEEEISLYNVTEDGTTLKFSSSSDVSVKVLNYYFTNASGTDVYRYPIIENGDYDDYKSKDANGNPTDINTTDFTYKVKNANGIPVSPEKTWEANVTAEATGVNGNIKINTDVPGDNAIRYVILEITNTEGLSKRVKVAIYPLEYITFNEGWYSYREDFGGTTYEICGDKFEYGEGTTVNSERVTNIRYSASGSVINGDTDNWYVNWTSGTNFRSKYAAKSGNSFSINYYKWEEDTGRMVIGKNWVEGYYKTEEVWDWDIWDYVEREVWVEGHYEYVYSNESGYIYILSDNGSSSLDNPRMYNVHISATSNEYNIGAPKLNDRGVTDGGADNAKLVSPSFQLASQLGAYSATAISDVRVAGDHCKYYVEAYKELDKDGKPTGKVIHLHDWRLPTQAELKFVQIYQTYSPAMATVLTGDNYWAANGLIVTKTGELYNGTGTVSSNSDADRAIRCVRDAFMIPEQRTGADGKNYPIIKDSYGNIIAAPNN